MFFSLALNTTGYGKTATGINALFDNTTGSNNTTTGGGALQFNTDGDHNTANGAFALYPTATTTWPSALRRFLTTQ